MVYLIVCVLVSNNLVVGLGACAVRIIANLMHV